MVVATDIGSPADIHPKNKQDIGKRLAYIALQDNYKKKGEFSSPLYHSMKISGDRIELSFTPTGSGWLIKDKDNYLKGFEIAANDKKFYPAMATASGDKIILQSVNVVKPVAVRYNWADDASEGNLYNREQFPLAPFRTDNWEGITYADKYSF